MKKLRSLALAGLFASFLVSTSHAQFADAVVAYTPGSGVTADFTNHTEVALGAPSQVNPYGEPVDVFDPPYGTNQIVSVGTGGSLTLKFNSPIVNSPGNKFGLDFIIYGNAGFIITNDFDFNTFTFVGTPATDGSMFGDNAGVTRVWVSKDGTNYFKLDPALAPTVDGLFPPDASGNPQKPVNPALTADSFAGQTQAGIATLYDGSGGGRGYDISWAQDTSGNPVVLDSIKFVRIDVVSGKSEIDAIAAVPPIITTQPITQTVTSAGLNITFSVNVSNATAVTYQWKLNGVDILDATNSSLTFNNALSTANAGNYSVAVSSDSGSVESSAATLNKPVPTGIYNGLFYETNVVKFGRSGYFTFTISNTKPRMFSGKNFIEGGSYPLIGVFGSNHLAQVSIARPGKTTLIVNLQLLTANAADQVIGTVSDGTWTAKLLGDRVTFNASNPAPQMGNYTYTLFTDSNGDDAPSYGSFGSITVKTNGALTVTGTLSDTTSSPQSTYVSKNGEWPLYVPLYQGKGSLLGWVTFTNLPTLKLTGDVSWIKTNASGAYYTNGFTNTVTVYGGSRHP